MGGALPYLLRVVYFFIGLIGLILGDVLTAAAGAVLFYLDLISQRLDVLAYLTRENAENSEPRRVKSRKTA